MKQPIKPLIAKLDRIFSQYIRLKNADENGICTCVTCGSKHHWKELDCGHFVKRQYQSTRFNEMNCWPQCRKCNWLEQGADARYQDYIIKTYGVDGYDKLMWLKGQTKKWTAFELEQLIKHYTEQVKNLNLY